MTIDITKHWMDSNHWLISNSVANLGNEAAAQTWAKAVEASELHPIITKDNEDEVKDYLRSFGAWSDEEIDGYSQTELGAFIYQEVSAEHNRIHEGEHMGDDGEIDWAAVYADDESYCPIHFEHVLVRGFHADVKWFFTIGA
tara:strand:+ start:1108 stop:1533 length:426 start_codon:yes stop_codon:yes gene_type:complete